MSISNSLRFRVLTRDNFTCRYCGRKAPDVVLEVDHVVPVSAGGRDTEDNLVAACFDCNRAKGPKAIPARADSPAPAQPPTRTAASALVGHFFLRPCSTPICDGCGQPWPQMQQGIIAQTIDESHVLCIPFSWLDGARLPGFGASVDGVVAEQWQLYPAGDRQLLERFFRRCAAHLREHDHDRIYDPPDAEELAKDLAWARDLLVSLHLAPQGQGRSTSRRSNVTT